MALLTRSKHGFDLQKLVSETSRARQILDFEQGPYGHAISLPSAADISEPFRGHQNNVPFSNALAECPYLSEIFHSFATEKAAFRLLRRAPKSAYAIHDDKDKGTRIRRFQIPILTNSQAWLLLADHTDFAEFESVAARAAESEGDIWFDLHRLDQILRGQFKLFLLEPSYIHYFDTDQFHTLINAGGHERIVLSIDLVLNDWLEQWMDTELTESVAADPVGRTANIQWQWNALRNGLIRNA